MILHGSTYVTFDLDLAISADDSSSAAMVRALAPLHPFPPQLGSASNFVWDERSFQTAVVELITDAGQIDILRIVPGVDSFDGLWERSEVRKLSGLDVRVACIDDLIAMKSAANRAKDRDHIRQLQILRSLNQS